MNRPAFPGSAISWIPLLILAAPLPLAAEPAPGAPPWSIGSPAAAGLGARFGLGLRFDFEQLESLDWESSATGVQVPLALPCFRPNGSLCLFPTLTLEAASVDVTFDPGIGPSRHGNGDLFGAGLDVTFALCDSCSGFAGAGYHFKTIPAFDLQSDGGPLEDARMSRDTHVASVRLGYVLPGNRFAPYVGLRGQWRDVVVEEFRRSTRLESDVTEGILGVDARLGGPLFARLEIMAGGPDKDCGIQVNLAYVGPRAVRPERAGSLESRERTEERTEERAREIAGAVALRLEEVLARFVEARRNLPVETTATGLQVYSRDAVEALLNDTERDLLGALSGFELTAMRDYVQDLFHQARLALGLVSGSQGALRLSAPPRLASLHPSLLQPAQPSAAALDKGSADSWLDRIEEAIKKILEYSRNDDLVVDLCVKSVPKNRAELSMHPISYNPPVPQKVRTNGRIVNVWRGLYRYNVSRRGFKAIQDNLNLVDGSGPVLGCELAADSSPETPYCQLRTGSIERECPE